MMYIFFLKAFGIGIPSDYNGIMNPSGYYILANVFAIIVFVVLLAVNSTRSEFHTKKIMMNHLLLFSMLVFFQDIFWTIVNSKPSPVWQLLLTNYVMFLTTFGAGLSWFLYSLSINRITDTRFFRFAKLGVLFYLVVVLLMIPLTFGLSWFWVRENAIHPLYWIITFSCVGIFLVLTIVFSVRGFLDRNQLPYHKEYLINVIGPLVVASCSAIQMFNPYLPLICYGMMFVELVDFLLMLSVNSKTDPLTGLNNRNELLRYVSRVGHDPDARHVVIMADLNCFKNINDTYGHVKGDEVLIHVSDVLMKFSRESKKRIFLGRYGGDEFVVIIKNGTDDDARNFGAEVNAELGSDANEIPVTMTIGYGQWKGGSASFDEALKVADKFMYEKKKGYKA